MTVITQTQPQPATLDLVERIRKHRVFAHLMFEHWAQRCPEATALGAMFHQIQKFCASTRPGRAFPDALASLGLHEQRDLMQEIVESESGHGSELAEMAGYLVNACAKGGSGSIDMTSTASIEAALKSHSDVLLGALPGYDRAEGLTAQARHAIAVLERREATDHPSTIRNLGTALALEIVSNQHLIPGEKAAIVDSGNYGVSLESPPLHYLKEHWGECGAEQQHERNVIMAVDHVIDRSTQALITEGAMDFLNALAALWDVIDASLLQSGVTQHEAHAPSMA